MTTADGYIKQDTVSLARASTAKLSKRLLAGEKLNSSLLKAAAEMHIICHPTDSLVRSLPRGNPASRGRWLLVLLAWQLGLLDENNKEVQYLAASRPGGNNG